MRVIVLFFLISGMLTACGSNDSVDKKNIDGKDEKLQIVSTIKPIQSIVLAIAGEHANSTQLIPDYASPHNYNFKPSDIRKVENADVIFRIDEYLESQLNALFSGVDENKISVLSKAAGITLLDVAGNDYERKNISKLDGRNSVDFHLWSSPTNALRIATEVAKKLSKLDIKNAKNYKQNLLIFEQALNSQAKMISATLKAYEHTRYIVFHNSWQYFAKAFGLQEPIVVDLHESVSRGAKTVSEIRTRIQDDNIQCVFYEASVSEARLKLFTGNVKATKVDVLAKETKISRTAYINWLSEFAKQVETCLSN